MRLLQPLHDGARPHVDLLMGRSRKRTTTIRFLLGQFFGEATHACPKRATETLRARSSPRVIGWHCSPHQPVVMAAGSLLTDNRSLSVG